MTGEAYTRKTIKLSDRVVTLHETLMKGKRDLNQRYYYNNVLMENDRLLSDYNIQENGMIESTPNPLIVAFVNHQIDKLRKEGEENNDKRNSSALIIARMSLNDLNEAGSAIPYIGEDYERIKDYLKPCRVNTYGMQFELMEYNLIDKVYGADDPISHFILRTSGKSKEPKAVLDRYKRMIDRMYNKDAIVDDDTEEEEEIPKTPVMEEEQDNTAEEEEIPKTPIMDEDDVVEVKAEELPKTPVMEDDIVASPIIQDDEEEEEDLPSTQVMDEDSEEDDEMCATQPDPMSSDILVDGLNNLIGYRSVTTKDTNSSSITITNIIRIIYSNTNITSKDTYKDTYNYNDNYITNNTNNTNNDNNDNYTGSVVETQKTTSETTTQTPRPLKKAKSTPAVTDGTVKKTVKVREYYPKFMSVQFAHLIALSMVMGPVPVETLHEYSQIYSQQDLVTADASGKKKLLKTHSELEDKRQMLTYDEPTKNITNTPKGIVFGKIYHDFYKDKMEFNRLNECTPPVAQKEIIVVIDDREKHVDRLLEYLGEWGIRAIKRRLRSGDYLFLQRPDNGAEPSQELLETNMYPFLIERKTFEDFQASIFDERWKTQRNRMLMSTVLRRKGLFYLVEGTEQGYKQGYKKSVTFEEITQLMDNMVCSSDFHVLRTTSQYDTIKHIAMFAKMLESEPDESRGLERFYDFDQAIKLGGDVTGEVTEEHHARESMTWNGETFREYVMNPQYRRDAMVRIRANRELKLLVMTGVKEYKKVITTTADKLLKEYIIHHRDQTPLKTHYSHNNLLLSDHLDPMYVDYYLLHIQVILGAKTFISPTVVGLHNLNQRVNTNQDLTEMFKIRPNPDDKTFPLYKHQKAKHIEFIPHNHHHMDIISLSYNAPTEDPS
eukprot:gene1473-1711_t